MIDCSNAEIRDQLPELVNGQLAGESLAAVRTHVASCSPCQSEVQLIERARAALILATPRIDASRIAQSLPTPRAASRSRMFDWRIAATIAVLAVGGGGTAVMYSNHSAPQLADTMTIASMDGTELPIATDLSGLTDEQLSALVGSMKNIDALPAAEAASVSGIAPTAIPDSSGVR
jgi:hypothetical protein